MGEPLGSGLRVVHFLQFLPCPQVAPLHACDGSRIRRSRVERTGIAGDSMMGFNCFPAWPRPPSSSAAKAAFSLGTIP